MNLYRYEYSYFSGKPELIIFTVMKETEKSYFINDDLLRFFNNKRIRKNAKKEYASKDEITALKHFLERKKSQIKILEANLEIAKKSLAYGLELEKKY